MSQPKWPAARLRRPSRLLAPLVNVDGAALTIEAEGVNHGCPAALGSPWFVLRLLGGVGVMRKKLLVICGLFVLVGTIAVAAVLGTAGIGKAASTNTCALVGPSPGTPNCLTVGVFPGQLSPTGQGLLVAKFVNQGSSTATHTTITVKLPTNVSAVSVSPSALCSAPAATITCSFGNIAGFGTAKVSVVFSTSAAAGTTLSGISANVAYAEGNGNSGTPSNDSFSASGNSISVVNGTSQAGNCTTTTGTNLLSTNLNGQTTKVNTLSSLLPGLPCTPIAAGVELNDGTRTCGAAKCTSPVSMVILPTTGTATLIIPVSALASGMNASKFVLYWFTETGLTGTPLMKCSDTEALPPVGPKPTPGTDTCIQSQTDLKIGNVKYIQDDLKIFGVSLVDAKFIG